MSENIDNLKESLSALMDSEANDLELRRVLKSLHVDDLDQGGSLKQSWYSYHVVRESLQNQPFMTCSSSFLTGIQCKIAEEATPVGKTSSHKSHKSHKLAWAFGQGAIAASVAALVIVAAVNTINTNSDQTDIQAASSLLAVDQSEQLEINQIANISGEFDELSYDRLRQAVHKEFDQDSEPVQVPVRFIIEGNR